MPEIIEFITNSITLEPGDVIATGTPAGVGFARKPPVFLKPGDRMEVEVEHFGGSAIRSKRAKRNGCAASALFLWRQRIT